MRKIYVWVFVFVCCLTIGFATLSKTKKPENNEHHLTTKYKQVTSPIPDKVAYEFLITFLTEWKDKEPAGIEAYLARDNFNPDEANVIFQIITEHKMKIMPIENELRSLRENQKNHKAHLNQNENDQSVKKIIELGTTRDGLIVEASAKLQKHLGKEGNKKLDNLINRIKSLTKITTNEK